VKPEPKDLRFGHDLSQIQDENGVDLALLRANLALTVEERLLALEQMIRFAESVRRVERPPSRPPRTTPARWLRRHRESTSEHPTRARSAPAPRGRARGGRRRSNRHHLADTKAGRIDALGSLGREADVLYEDVIADAIEAEALGVRFACISPHASSP